MKFPPAAIVTMATNNAMNVTCDVTQQNGSFSINVIIIISSSAAATAAAVTYIQRLH